MVRNRDILIGTPVLKSFLCGNAAALIYELLSHPGTLLRGPLGMLLAGVGHIRIRSLVGNAIEGSTMWERQLGVSDARLSRAFRAPRRTPHYLGLVEA